MKANTMTQDKLLSRQQAAEFLGVTKGTLEVWACTKRYNLPYVKVGKLVKYRQSDLIKFLDGRTVYQTSIED